MMSTDVMMQFELLDMESLELIEGGVNWDRVYGGATVYLGATMAVLSMTTPIGWGLGAAYIATSAISGAYIGYGLAT